MKTSLVILAAGLGSRFGGGSAKQVAALGKHGEIMTDYSVYDAIRGGFDKIVYIIKPEMKESFTANVTSKIKGAEVVLAYQGLDNLPEGFSAGARQKPWGTAHALWSAAEAVHEPFMMIHCDDFYGPEIFASINKFLRQTADAPWEYAMGGYALENTLSDHGGVSRGVCDVENGFVTDVTETHKIERRHDGIAYPAGNEWKYLPGSSVVSMGAFAFKPTIFGALEKELTAFLQTSPQQTSAELPLTDVVSTILTGGQASIKVIDANSQWFGMTYQEDIPIVQAAIQELVAKGVYPEKLF